MHGHVKSKELPIYGTKVLAIRNGTLDLHGIRPFLKNAYCLITLFVTKRCLAVVVVVVAVAAVVVGSSDSGGSGITE